MFVKYVTFWIFLALFNVGLLVSPLFADDTVVARVGGIDITEYELGLKVQKLLPLFGSFHSQVGEDKIQEFREKALAELIERNLKLRYALQEEIAVDNAEVEEAMAKATERYGSEANFMAAIGGNVAGFRASIYRDLLAEEAQDAAVDSKINVSDAEVREYYEENKSRFMRPKQFRASHILVKVDPSSNEEEKAVLKRKAEELVKRAKAGEDFYDLAYYNSDDRTKYVGGDLGYFHKGQTIEAFEEALLQLKVGEVSDPVKTRFGYHVIKLVEVNEARQLTFDEMKDNVRETIRKERHDALYGAWMEALREKFPVEKFEK